MKVTTNAVRCDKRETIWDEGTEETTTTVAFVAMFHGEDAAKKVKALTASEGSYWLTISDGQVRSRKATIKKIEATKKTPKRGRPKTLSPGPEAPPEQSEGQPTDDVVAAALSNRLRPCSTPTCRP